MRRVFAEFSPTVAATFAVGIAISLSVFLLPTGVVHKGPMTVLPAFGKAAGRVVADLPVAHRRASKARPAAPGRPLIVVALRPPTTQARPSDHRARTVVLRRTPPAPEPATAPAAPEPATAPAAPKTPVTRSQLFSMPPKAKGRALGHARRHEPAPNAATPAPHPPGHGKGLGHSDERQNRLPPGQAKKAPPNSASGPPQSPKSNGGGNGRTGNGDGDGGEGNGNGNGRGNGPKSEQH